MKRLKMLKKIVSSILVAIIVLGQFGSYSFVSRAETITTEEDEILSLTLSETSKSGFAYRSQDKKIWSFLSEESYASNLYCIKAEYGYSWETADNASPANSAIYDKSYKIPLQQATTISTTADNILMGQYKNQLLWLIDNLYIEGESDLDEYLAKAGIEYNSEDGYIYNPTLNTDYNYEYITNATEAFGNETVLPEDIIAIQQMAIWYYTNGLDTQNNPYNKLNQNPWLQVGTTVLLTLNEARAIHATIIYNYLIDKAQDVAEELGTNQYELKNSTAKLWISSTKDEQPVIEVHKKPKEFDLSLRKTIVEVTDDEGNIKNVVNAGGDNATRTVTVDETPLITETNADTTASYKHRKDPVKVETGDTVKYAITIYNEGGQDGYATIIKDQLPGTWGNGLRLESTSGTVTSTTGNIYTVQYDSTNNTVVFTMAENSPKKVLTAYEGEGTPNSETIYIECKIMGNADSDSQKVLTNIAYIAEDYNAESKTIQDRDSIQGTPQIPNLITSDIGYLGKDTNPTDWESLSNGETYYKGQEDDDDFEKVVILPKTFDLKLIKFISAVNDEPTGNRVLSVDTTKLNTTDSETTADYKLEKNPVAVQAGDFVTYTIRVYNEGNYDGYATEISEDIPEGLEFIVIADQKIYSWDGTKQKEITEEIKALDMYETIFEVNSIWGYNANSTIITTTALSEDIITGFGQADVEYADNQNNIDYKEIKLIYRVKADVEANQIIRNEAAISQDKAVNEQGQEIDRADRDSTPGKNDESWKKENSNETYDQEGKWPIYEEDDEDYDNIIIKAFDLSLRKQIIQINNALYTDRYAELLENAENANTLYDYYDVNSNKPKVRAGDKIVYSIRVYNEGNINGYASLVVDKLPAGLEFVEGSSINEKYGWTLVDGTEDLYQTDYLSYEKDANKGAGNSNLIKAYDGQGEADYKELKIECRVKADITKEDSLLNVAQIAKDSDEYGNPINDKDSVPGNSDDESKWKNEDDLDIENLQLQEFDLALRKFITEIENGEDTEKVTTRIPQVTYNKETKQLEYTHPKDAVVVHVGDTIIYTLRVYNEGDIDGYASEIKDDIPQYLEYLPKHETNIENEWVMYDKDGKITENVEEAVYIKTQHLEKGKGIEAEEESEGTNLIEAFDAETQISDKNPDYKEVKVAFKVKDPNSAEYEIVNFAQISDDSDSEGDPIEDKDSDPDNGEKDPREDDEDIEKVKVEYFDLSLLKYVTKVLVNEKGKERVIETGNVGDENDIIPHVQIDKKNIDKTTVKFVYTIQITNEGQIAGEATEITDYVPEGLVFMEEDNELWTDEGNNVISTMQLKGTTLQPGETAQVEVVLRWINKRDNMGMKINVAEISQDYNEENIPDRDSTPDNKKDGEDDIDKAEVLLSAAQGGGIQSLYINLSLTFLVIILVGAVLIKKFVL